MKPRLIWKILLAFWLLVVLTVGGVILTFRLQDNGRSRAENGPAALRTERLTAASVALRSGGPAALRQVTAAWPAQQRAELRVIPGASGAQLTLPAAPARRFPVWAIVVQVAASLVFSVALGVYLARPIARLRDGFRRLAEGELDTRLTPGMGRRRDEIADLAHDFDRMAERLQHLVASRDRLLHDVSHELRSPLARLSLAIGLARQNRELGEQTLLRVEAESERLNTIVGDLLSLSRAESELGAEDIYFDVGTLLQMVCDDANFEAQPRQVRVELVLDPNLADPAQAPLMKGVPELLRRALDNVIRNALRFSPTGENVTVRGWVEDGSVLIEVLDRGPGASGTLLKTMFDPFIKGPGESGGVGLGLAIARRAIAAHGGELAAYNQVGGGLAVRLSIPIGAAPTRHQSESLGHAH